jgi:two-component system NtrC family sensor kinase
MRRLYDKLESTWIGSLFLRPIEVIYTHLKRNLFFQILVVAVVPTLFMGIGVYYQFKNIIEHGRQDQLNWQLVYTQKSLDNFFEEHMAALRLVFESYTIEQFKDQNEIQHIFTELNKSFPNFVDLGLVDSTGVQKTYDGPYFLELTDKNYSSEPWFQEVLVRSRFISDVFLGNQNIPHVLMAIKSPTFGKGKFWVIRAAVNTSDLDKMVSAISLGSEDDAFVINRKCILQNSSRFHGGILSRHCMPMHETAQNVMWTEGKNARNEDAIIAYTSLHNKDWTLTFVQPLSERHKYFSPVHRIMIGVMISGFVFVFMLAWLMTRNFTVQLRKAEHEKEAYLHTAEQTEKLASIGRLAAGVAHEINNPLAIINEDAGLMSDLTEMSADFPNKKKFEDLLHSIQSSVKRCRTITHRLLGFARQMDVSPEAIDINALIQEVFGFLEREAVNRNIIFKFDLMEDLPIIESDRGQLQQVFLNIINNAMDAVDNKGEIDISTSLQNESSVGVKIRDNGCGIPKDKLKRIFDPFFSTKDRDKGTGLGLSITYGIIKKLGGKILADSELDKGTTFTIELPRSYKS